MALEQWRPQPGLIHHTDQGRQYSSTAYVEMLKKQAMVQSMSRRQTVTTTEKLIGSTIATNV